jgi:hypothetical protein
MKGMKWNVSEEKKLELGNSDREFDQNKKIEC